jgi:hypothetical protein
VRIYFCCDGLVFVACVVLLLFFVKVGENSSFVCVSTFREEYECGTIGRRRRKKTTTALSCPSRREWFWGFDIQGKNGVWGSFIDTQYRLSSIGSGFNAV